MTTPSADKSFEHAHKVFDRSSASTPKIDRLPKAPGLIQSSGLAAPGLIRMIPPEPKLPTYRVPSLVEVMFSGNTRSPGRPIDAGTANAPDPIRQPAIPTAAARRPNDDLRRQHSLLAFMDTLI